MTTDNRIVNKLLFSSNYMLSRFKVSTGLFFVAISCVWASLEEEDTADTLIVESETAEYSADVYIKEEEQGALPEAEKKEDKKRTNLGSGESASLMLTGKPLLIGDPSKISWTITEGQNLATLGRSGENAKSASLTVKKDIRQQGNIRIEVTVQSGKKVTINFVAIPPSGMSSKHRRRSYDRSNPDFNKRGVPILNADGDMVNAGASGLLEVTLSPTNVSFTNIHVIELDKGTVPDPPPSLATSHNPNPIPVAPDEKNRIGDQVGTSRPVSFLSQHQLPQNWYWDCDFNCYESRILMRNTKQRFIYEKQSLEGNIINVVSSKFDSSVSRTTASGNKHVF